MKALIKSANFGISMLLVTAAIAIAYIAVPAFGNKALIVRSGSMQPTIKVGDLVVVQTQKGLLSPQSITINKYKVGDTIAFSSEKNSKLLTTHRIVAKVVKDGKVFYQTKGDANNAADQNLVAEENIIGKTTIKLPYFGRLFAFAKSNVGFPLLVIFPALLVIILEMVNIFKEIKRQNRLVQVPAPKENFAGLKIIIPIFMSVMVMHNAFAYFSDTAQSTNNVFTAGQFGPPIAQTLVINEILYNTNCPNPQDKQWIELWNGSNQTVDLKDWSLRDQDNNTIQIVNSVTPLNSGQFALLSKSQATWNVQQCYGNLLPGTVTANLGGTININTSAGTIKLLAVGLNVVDRVDYGGATGLSAGVNRSVERKILGQDSVTGDNFNASDFEVREPATASFAIPQNQNVVINEFLVRTTSGNQDWVEIYNKSGSSVDISNWTLRDTTGIFHTFPSVTNLASGAFFATADMSNRLNNGGDKIYLYDNSGNLIDGISYFKFVPATNGTSIGRTTDGVATWSTFTVPTKNATNNTSTPGPLP